MQRKLDLLRAVFVSPEFCVIVYGLYLATADIAAIRHLMSRIEGAEVIKYLALIPVAILALLVKDVQELLSPKDKTHADHLNSWPDYWRLKNRVIASLIWSFLFACMAIVAWTVGKPDKNIPAFVCLLASLVGTAFTYWTVYCARIRLLEILRGQSGCDED